MANNWTQADADRLNIPLSLLNEWKAVMDDLWSFLYRWRIDCEQKQNPVGTLQEKENTIIYTALGQTITIEVYFINAKYLDMKLTSSLNGYDVAITINNITINQRSTYIRTLAVLMQEGTDSYVKQSKQ